MLAPEDRDRLNGQAPRDGYVARRDWHANGGLVLDVQTGESLVCGLWMPHSPRWYRDRLWVLNSGNGEFGYLDEQD